MELLVAKKLQNKATNSSKLKKTYPLKATLQIQKYWLQLVAFCCYLLNAIQRFPVLAARVRVAILRPVFDYMQNTHIYVHMYSV
jgi:hypothetical protein